MRKSRFTEEHGQDPPRGGESADCGRRQEARHQRPDNLRLAQALRRHESDDAKRLKQLEQENAKLKKMLADHLLAIDVLTEINARRS